MLRFWVTSGLSTPRRRYLNEHLNLLRKWLASLKAITQRGPSGGSSSISLEKTSERRSVGWTPSQKGWRRTIRYGTIEGQYLRCGLELLPHNKKRKRVRLMKIIRSWKRCLMARCNSWIWCLRLMPRIITAGAIRFGWWKDMGSGLNRDIKSLLRILWVLMLGITLYGRSGTLLLWGLLRKSKEKNSLGSNLLKRSACMSSKKD